RHDHAFGDYLVAFMVEGEGPEHRLLRVAVMQDRKCFLASRQLAEVDRWRGPGPGSGRRACRRPPALLLRWLELLAKFLPALFTTPAGSMVAPCIDSAAWKLNCERPVPVGAGERAIVQDVQRSALVGLLVGDIEAMLNEPFPEIENVFIPLCFRWSARQCFGQLAQ